MIPCHIIFTTKDTLLSGKSHLVKYGSTPQGYSLLAESIQQPMGGFLTLIGGNLAKWHKNWIFFHFSPPGWMLKPLCWKPPGAIPELWCSMADLRGKWKGLPQGANATWCPISGKNCTPCNSINQFFSFLFRPKSFIERKGCALDISGAQSTEVAFTWRWFCWELCPNAFV